VTATGEELWTYGGVRVSDQPPEFFCACQALAFGPSLDFAPWPLAANVFMNCDQFFSRPLKQRQRTWMRRSGSHLLGQRELRKSPIRSQAPPALGARFPSGPLMR
jgi:hypothetical protein